MGSVNISKTRRGESAYLIPTVSLRYQEQESYLSATYKTGIIEKECVRITNDANDRG